MIVGLPVTVSDATVRLGAAGADGEDELPQLFARNPRTSPITIAENRRTMVVSFARVRDDTDIADLAADSRAAPYRVLSRIAINSLAARAFPRTSSTDADRTDGRERDTLAPIGTVRAGWRS